MHLPMKQLLLISSPIAANGYIYLASERGIVTLLRAGDELDVVASNVIEEGIRSPPAIAGKTLFVRTKEHLWALGE